MTSSDTEYVFRPGVLPMAGDGRLQLSIGVWNYRTLVIDFKPEWNGLVRDFVSAAMTRGASLRGIVESGHLDSDESNEFSEMIERLYVEGFILEAGDQNKKLLGAEILLGLSEPQAAGLAPAHRSGHGKALVITDLPIPSRARLQSDYSRYVDFDTVGVEELPKMAEDDLTTRMSAMETMAHNQAIQSPQRANRVTSLRKS